MAIDTESRRRSAANPLVPILPVPDGAIGEADRRTVAGVYAGLEDPGESGTTRQIIFGIDPKNGLSGTYSWASVPDKNSSQKGITCAYVPETKGTGISLLQETVFMGTINANITLQSFRDDLAQDDGVVIGGELITARIDPTQKTSESPLAGGAFTDSKRFNQIVFPELNPLDKGLSVEISRDARRPDTETPVWQSLARSPGRSKATVEKGVARWLNMRIVDNTTLVMTPVFGSFMVSFYSLGVRDGDEVGV